MHTIWNAGMYEYLKTNTYLADRLKVKDSHLQNFLSYSNSKFSQAAHRLEDILNDLHSIILMVHYLTHTYAHTNDNNILKDITLFHVLYSYFDHRYKAQPFKML